MKLIRTSDIKQVDSDTLNKQHIDEIQLIRRVAALISQEIINRWDIDTPFIVFAGPGNNGADALATALILVQQGYNVKTYLFCPNKELSEACTAMREELTNEPLAEFYEILAEFKPPVLTKRTVIIDGLFGSGLNKPLSGGFAGIIKYINSSPSYRLSIDIPSGFFGENNSQNDPNAIIQADLVLTLQLPKVSFLLSDSAPYVKEYKVLDIGLDQESIDEVESPFHMVEINETKSLVKQREKFTHKGNYGHGLIVAGKLGMMGAAQLSAKAACKTGIGLLTVHAPRTANAILQTAVPEAIYSPDPSQICFSEAPSTDEYSNIAVGPGLGSAPETLSALSQLLNRRHKPMIIDADALNLIGTNRNLLNQIPQGSILTPHPKEFDRIMGPSNTAFERLEKAIKLSKQFRLVVVLKGANTATVLPNGEVYFNSTGNPGMATAGSGDVLTGVLLSLLAQGYNPAETAILGVYLHGLAGDLAAEELTEAGVTASDIVQYLPKALLFLQRENLK